MTKFGVLDLPENIKVAHKVYFQKTDSPHRNLKIEGQVLKIIVIDENNNAISFTEDFIDDFIERLQEYKERWNLN